MPATMGYVLDTLPNVTNGLLQKQNQQRRYLGIKPDVVINNHYKDIQNADTNDINIGTNDEKHDTTHATSLLNIEEQATYHPPTPVEEQLNDETNVMNTITDDPLDMDTYLKQRYPRKYEKSQREWYFAGTNITTTTHLDRLVAPLTLLLKILSCSIIEVSVMLIKRLLNRNENISKQFETETDDTRILNSIKSFMMSNVRGGRTEHELTEAKNAILTACLFDGQVSKATIQTRLEVSIARISKVQRNEDTLGYLHMKQKEYETKQGPKHLQCISEFCHSDESSVIDSNSRKIVTVKGEKHVGRVWVVPTVREQYRLFQNSDTVEKYKKLDTHFTIPSESFFYHNRCPCVSRPVMQSCVDLRTSQLQHYMRAIGKYIRAHPLVSEKIKQCNCEQHSLTTKHWQNYVGGTCEDFIESTCCAKMSHPHLAVGVGSTCKVPKLLNRSCVLNECHNCGVEKKLMVSTCPILAKDTQVISVMEWVLAERQGVNKTTGKANTQLELGVSTLSVTEVVKKLICQLDICCTHQYEYEWRN